MKMKSVKAFLSIVTAASLAVSAPAAVFAEDAAAQEEMCIRDRWKLHWKEIRR